MMLMRFCPCNSLSFLVGGLMLLACADAVVAQQVRVAAPILSMKEHCPENNFDKYIEKLINNEVLLIDILSFPTRAELINPTNNKIQVFSIKTKEFLIEYQLSNDVAFTKNKRLLIYRNKNDYTLYYGVMPIGLSIQARDGNLPKHTDRVNSVYFLKDPKSAGTLKNSSISSGTEDNFLKFPLLSDNKVKKHKIKRIDMRFNTVQDYINVMLPPRNYGDMISFT